MSGANYDWSAPVSDRNRGDEMCIRDSLYTRTRGINRFQGLARALREADSKYGEIPGIDELEHWAESTDELSERSLQRAASDPGITEEGRLILNKALSWSRAVNDAIDRIPDDEKKQMCIRDSAGRGGQYNTGGRAVK